MKPRLFHGSAHEVTALKVHENETADKKERREFVFAMPNEVTAAAYALKNAAVCGTSHDDWCYLLVSQDVRVAPGRRVDWMAELPKSARGAGGFVYEVPADSFSRKGSGEWVSSRIK